MNIKEPKIHKHLKNKIALFFLVNIILTFIFGFIYWLDTVIINYIAWKYPKFLYKYQKYIYSTKLSKKDLEPDYDNKKNPSLSDIFHLDEIDYWIYISLITQSTVGYGGITDKQGSVPFRSLSHIFRSFNILQIILLIATPIIVGLVNYEFFT